MQNVDTINLPSVLKNNKHASTRICKLMYAFSGAEFDKLYPVPSNRSL